MPYDCSMDGGCGHAAAGVISAAASHKFWNHALRNDLPELTDKQVFAITSRGNMAGKEGYERVMKAGTLSALQKEVLDACRRGGGCLGLT